MTALDLPRASAANVKRPRLGFLGTGWIGLNRMKALVESELVEPALIVEPSPEMAAEASRIAPGAGAACFEDILSEDLDGVVIATPSALHAEQSIRCLDAGLAVFCQKPLGRTAAEVQAVIGAAKSADRLLGLDLSYRHTAAMRQIKQLVSLDHIGSVHAVDLVFHNAYGPDKAWFYDPGQSGGGCVMDLGVHLVDLALWTLGFPVVETVESTLFQNGRRVADTAHCAEDYAVATLHLQTGAVVRLACSWRLPAGCDAVISASFYGQSGGAALRNVGGSFYDFTAELYRGTARETLAEPPDDWGGRAAVSWARELAEGKTYSPEAERFVEVAAVLDRIYGR
jgi:predicted dehydrogenase